MHPDRKPLEPHVRDKSALAAWIAPAMWGGCSCAHDSSHRFALDGVSLDAARAFVEDAISAAMAEAPPQVVTMDTRLRVFNLEVQPGAPHRVVIWLWTPLRCVDLAAARSLSPAPRSLARSAPRHHVASPLRIPRRAEHPPRAPTPAPLPPRRRWFDVIDLKFARGPTADSVAVRSRTYATGFVPLTYTWSLTMSALFCWLPFGGAPVSRLVELEALFRDHLAKRGGLAAAVAAPGALEMDRGAGSSCL